MYNSEKVYTKTGTIILALEPTLGDNKMDYNTLRMLGLNEKLEKNKRLSSRLKVIAGGCLVLSFAYCAGSVIIEHLDKSEVKATNFVWIVSIIALVVIYLKDVRCIKSSKATEFEIYRLEVEDLNAKKKVADVTGNRLPDNIYDKQINVPDETIFLPIAYYGILIGIDIIIRIYLFVNHVI